MNIYQLRYIWNGVKTVPFLPLLYFQGKKIKRTIPDLPDATDNIGSIELSHQETRSVLFLGESTIAGVGAPSHKGGFVGFMASGLAELWQTNIDYDVIATSGWRAKELADEVAKYKINKKYDLIVIGLGGNDTFQFTSPENWLKEIKRLIANIKSQDQSAPIVFCNLPPTSDFLAFTPLLRKVMGNMTELLRVSLSEKLDEMDNVFFNQEKVSLSSWTGRYQLDPDPSIYFSDGVHPSVLTYRIWAEEMVGFISRNAIGQS